MSSQSHHRVISRPVTAAESPSATSSAYSAIAVSIIRLALPTVAPSDGLGAVSVVSSIPILPYPGTPERFGRSMCDATAHAG